MTTTLRSTRHRPADLGPLVGKVTRPSPAWPDLGRPDESAVRAAHLAPWRDPGSPLFAQLVEQLGSTRHGVPTRPVVVVHVVDAPAADEQDDDQADEVSA